SEVERILQERARCETLGKGSLSEDPLRDFEALIRRMIVDDNELDVREGLPIDRLQALFDVRFMLIASDDDAGQHADFLSSTSNNDRMICSDERATPLTHLQNRNLVLPFRKVMHEKGELEAKIAIAALRPHILLDIKALMPIHDQAV